MTNLLLNPSFESGHYHHNGIAELQIPNDWNFWHAIDKIPNPHDSASHSKFGQPEVRVLPAAQLPEHERPLFILDGDHCLKIFRGNGAWWANLSQTLELEPGTYALTVHIFADLVKGYDDGYNKIWADDPQGRDGLFRFIVNYQPDAWQSLHPGEWNHFTITFHAESETTVAVGIMCPFALKNSGIFADAWSLIRIHAPGLPRKDYDRIYNVIPGHATEAQAVAIFLEGWRRSCETAGGSYDDAMMGQLTHKTANLYGIPPLEQPDFVDFRDQYYPGTQIHFLPMPSGATPGDEPPPGGTRGGRLTLHCQTTVPYWLQFIWLAQPAWVKVFWLENAADIKAVSPDTKVLYRHHVDHQAPFLQNPDKRAAVNQFLARFWEGIEKNPDVDAIEGLNETIATNDIAGIHNAVDFAVALSHEVARRGKIAVLLNTAVGNPQHGEQTALLIPAAEAAVAHNHYLGYHAYWWASPLTGGDPGGANGLTSWWKHHAGRALESWDLTFSQAGLAPRYLFTECGVVGTPDGGYNLLPGDGWKSPRCMNGDWERYLNHLLVFATMIELWNEKHGGRAEAAMIFTTGIGVGWDSFQLQTDELRKLAAAL